MFFFAVTRVSESLVWFKTVLLCLEGLTLWLLAKLLVSYNLPRERILIHAWNPLVVWELSSGHIDFLMTALVLLALLARGQRRDTLTGILFGCAVLVKFLPVVLFPALYRRWGWKMPFAAVTTMALCYLPYLGAGAGVFGFLSGYAGEEGMGDGRFFLLLLARYLAGGAAIPVAAYLIIASAAMFLLSRRALWKWNEIEGGYLRSAGWLGAAFLFFVSPQFPWYWIWLTPFLAFLPMPALWPCFYVSCAALLQYGKWFDDWDWFGIGINPFFARDLLQFAPATILGLALYLYARSGGMISPLQAYRRLIGLVPFAARNASPAVQIAAPRRSRSLARNCPGIGDKNGKP
ncbi:MAG: glycosyltransferase 87 family protein [Verrucomicrobiota bacterium]|nr:glycosyltransferase 87 family protein [Verrucomicrobiota bacterium]